MTANFWQGKRVLMTGHTGFKGSWLTFWLNEIGAEVHGISLKPETKPNAFEAMGIESRCRHHILDIRERKNLDDLVHAIRPQVVFHMAAQPFVRLAYANPIETYETNVIGTAAVLYSLRDISETKSVVVVTTDKCYENREWSWGYREADELGGFDPYSSSKACAEILTASFRRSFFLNREVGIATARAGNVIGGGDWSSDRLVPDLVRAAKSGNALEVRFPDSTRPWQHVLVPLSGYLILAERLWSEPRNYSTPFNFAPDDDDCVPVRDFIRGFGEAWGAAVPWKTDAQPKVHEAHFLKLDSSLARTRLQWRPRMKLPEALRQTAEWYRTYFEKGDVPNLTRIQIQKFCSLEDR